MNKRVKKALIVAGIAGVAVLSVCIVGMVILSPFSPPTISIKKMEKIFQEDYDLLVSVAEYFQNSGCSSIVIHKSDERGYMTVLHPSPDQLVKKVPIEDPEVFRIIDSLFEEKGYWTITRDGNTICFNRWSSLAASRGIAYTIDGAAPEMQYLTYYAKLSKEHWYYYKTD